MQFPFAALLAIAFSLEAFAAPVNGLEIRKVKAKPVAKPPAPIKAPAPPKKAPATPVAPPKPPVKAPQVPPKSHPSPAKAPPVPSKAPAPPAKPSVKASAPPSKPSAKASAPPSRPSAKASAPPSKPSANASAPPAKASASSARTSAKASAPPAKASASPAKASAPPAKSSAPPAKASASAKASSIAPAKSASKSAASAVPSITAECTQEQLDAREVAERASISHPAGTGTITLFHGTSPENADALVNSGAVDLSKTNAQGDFNHRPEVPGGFYMTDSLVAAAQFACFRGLNKNPASVDVLQFTWDGAGVNVHTFPGQTADWTNFQIYNSNPNEVVNTKSPFFNLANGIYQSSEMIVGPLNGPADSSLTDQFQQYAVVNQQAATNNLVLQNHFKTILCKNVPQGNRVDATLYEQGQAGNAKFNSRVAKLQDPNYKPGGATCRVQ